MKKFVALLLAVLMVAGMFAGCGSNEAAETKAAAAAEGETAAAGEAAALKIGMTGPLTGGAAVYGTAVEAGIEIAVEEINAAAAANGGLTLEFQAQDDEADGEKAVSGYNVLKDWACRSSSAPLLPAPATLSLLRQWPTRCSC